MKYSESIKPISYLKVHASEVIKDVSENHKTLVITHNGEAKVILQDVKLYEKTLESLAMLKILSLGNKSLKKGKFKPIQNAIKDVNKKIERFKSSQK